MAASDIVTASAATRDIAQAPRKVSLVAALVRGRTVADALTILDYTPKRAALVVRKAIQSAKANAAHNFRADDKSLIITQLSVVAGPRLKRYRAGARGMAKPYQKRTSHIYVEVAGTVKKRAAKPAAAKPAVKEEEK
ncbi:50S ribosomal protein L22 [Candidatus Saccharibacteria bacterium]|nr:50S ribosomal protein L22 [Candidatus Saccharibacteria bacterium]